MIDYPNEAFDYLQKNNLIESIVKYVINKDKFRTAVYLKNWLKDQVENLTPEFIELAESIVKDVKKDDYDTMMLALFRFCKNKKLDKNKFLLYKPDKDQWGVDEYWQTFLETLMLKTGDCEDGAIFLYCLARAVGIPANRLLIFCGDVEDKSSKTGTGGHCWLAYRPMKDPINLRFMDWCYWYNDLSIYQRPSFFVARNNLIQGEDNRYIKMWWAFSELGTFLKFKPTYEE